jgi:hypothetical protein
VLGGIGRLLDHARAGRPFGHRFADQQRDERTGKADDERHHRQRSEVDALRRNGAAKTEHVHDQRQHQNDGEIGGKEKNNALHGGQLPN